MEVAIEEKQLKVKHDPVFKELQKIREEHARYQKHDYSQSFQEKSRMDLIRLSFIIIGIEFAYSAETAFASPLLLEIGVDHKQMTMAWVFSPLLGFFMSPLMGSVSDKCKLAYGRRRPFMLFMSVGILLGMLLIPYGQNVGAWIGDTGDEYVSGQILNETLNITYSTQFPEGDKREHVMNFKYSIIMVILGTVLLDINADACQIFARSYLLDVCLPFDQPKALSTYSIMAGVGAFLGYVLAAINWKNTSLGEFLGGTIKTVFIIVIVIFIFSVIYTITSVREIPLPLIEQDNLLKPITLAELDKEKIKRLKEKEKLENVILLDSLTDSTENGIETKLVIQKVEEENEENDDEPLTLLDYLKSIVIMPLSMRLLCFTNLLCWMSHLCYCLYFTAFVGEIVFLGDPYAPKTSEKYQLFEEGVSFGCWGMALYSLTCSIYVFLIEKLIKIVNPMWVYVVSLLVDSAGMLVLAMFPTKVNVIIFSAICGILLAILFTMPYFLVAKYHTRKCFNNSKDTNTSTKHKRGLGTDIAVVGGMIFLAQIIVALTIGPFIALLGTTSAVVYADSILSFLGAISATQIIYLD